MRADGTFNFTGQVASATPMYKEACSLVVWPLDRSPVTNRKRWLRKFLRMAPGRPLSFNGPAIGADPLPDLNQQDLLTYASTVQQVETAQNIWNLCSDQGDLPAADPEVRPYLYTRDIGR